MPLSVSCLQEYAYSELSILGENLRVKLRSNYVCKDNKGKIGNFFLPACKSEIQAIDNLLADNVEYFSREFFENIRLFNENFSRANVSVDDCED